MADNTIHLWDDAGTLKWLLVDDAVAVDQSCCCGDCCCLTLEDKTVTATITPSYECPVDPDGADVVIPLTFDAVDNCWRGTGTGPACWDPDDVTVEMVCGDLLWDKTLPAPDLNCNSANYIWVRLKTATDTTNWYSKSVTEVGCIDMCLGGGLFTGLLSGTPIVQVTTCCPTSPGTMGSVCILAT